MAFLLFPTGLLLADILVHIIYHFSHNVTPEDFTLQGHVSSLDLKKDDFDQVKYN